MMQKTDAGSRYAKKIYSRLKKPMNAKVLDLEGKEIRQMELPIQFGTELRGDVVRRAFLSERSMLLQPKGAYPMAGLQTTAEYYGRRHSWRQIINTGRSRLPREKIPKGRSGRVLRVPHATKGRRAHPPKPQKRIIERINIKEKYFAIRSAIAATINAELVAGRGHIVDGATLPLIVDNAIESVKKAKEIRSILVKLGVGKDMERAAERRRMRSGRARLRKGGYLTPRSVLIVVGSDNGVWKAARNLPGVDVCKVEELTAELLAPGGEMGRLTLWTENAVQKLAKENLYM
ncbi:MAG TPA: 50S ribosomal protein L4 [Candidatus Norongarragalinales archaeon]|nr:50S ribosomal protein L4 [Candidatus Norongarragalinales archaeon]